MDKFVIKGWGIISELGNNEENILKNWDEKKEIAGGSLEFTHNLNMRKIRRMSRLAKMITSVSQNSLQMAEEDVCENMGIMMNTAYGSINVNLDFGKLINTPDLASPMDFANTVSNAALGHVALYFNLKGPSTLLMGSNVISYATRQLEKNNSDAIIVCGGDEYCEPIDNYAQRKFQHKCLGEGAAAILLDKDVGKDSKWGYIIGEAQGGIGFSPLYEECNDVKEKYEKLIEKAIKNSEINKVQIDMIFMSSDKCSGIRTYEDDAVNEIFGSRMPRVFVKDYMGESFGAGVLSSVIVASVMVKNRRYNTILVLGLEVSGTLEAFIVSK